LIALIPRLEPYALVQGVTARGRDVLVRNLQHRDGLSHIEHQLLSAVTYHRSLQHELNSLGDGHEEPGDVRVGHRHWAAPFDLSRSEEHTSELQSRFDLVCRLLLNNRYS